MLENDHEIRDALERGKVLAVLEIKEDFSRKILSKEAGEIFIIADGRKSNAAQITVGYITDIAQNFNASVQLSAPQSKLVPRNWYNANLNYTWFTITGLIGILSMLTSLSVTALSIAREREMGTLEQLLVSPLSPSFILIGKALPALFIGVLEGSVMLLAGVIFLNLPIRGNILLLYPSMIVFVFSIVGIGLFISSLSKTQQQSVLGVFLCVAPLVIMSGFATPIENMPSFLQKVALLNPLKYFLTIVRGICLKEISVLTIVQNTWPMLCIAIVTLTAASWIFRKRIG
jgi:ABC-2 type transport system permease protein